MEAQFRCQRSRRDVVRAAEGRQEVVKCVLVRQIYSRYVKTPLVSITLEEVVFSDRGVEEIPLLNPGRIMVVIAGTRGWNTQ